VPPETNEIATFVSFQEYIAAETENAWVFSDVQFHGSLDALTLSIRIGTCSCITDGSFKNKHGTAAWKIINLSSPDHTMEGQVVTLGFSYQQDAYRSELSRLYASVTAINVLTTYFQISEGPVTLACDNISAI
jgi:hypothetical protein